MRNFVMLIDFCNQSRREDTAEVVVTARDVQTAAGIAVQEVMNRGWGSRPCSPAGAFTASTQIHRVVPVTRPYLRSIGGCEFVGHYKWRGRFAENVAT
jgi:hypothetical protein